MKAVKEQLASKGWAVVDEVIPREDCDLYIEKLAAWKDGFNPDFPDHFLGCVINQYNIGHHEVPWEVRVKSKPVWAELWGTDKLLCSVDAIAIGPPPEMGKTKFDQPGVHTLHHDQAARRKGFHAYQGAVYLEEALEDDWCFEVLENSHLFHEEFFRTHPLNSDTVIDASEVQWYADRGCHRRRIAIPKGGMVMWDSRTIHMGAPPKMGRKNPGRWRYVVLVCMSPAIWASPEDLAKKKLCYDELRTAMHWPCNDIILYEKNAPHKMDITELPGIAKTREARLIAGVDLYDLSDGKPNGPQWKPVVTGPLIVAQ